MAISHYRACAHNSIHVSSYGLSVPQFCDQFHRDAFALAIGRHRLQCPYRAAAYECSSNRAPAGADAPWLIGSGISAASRDCTAVFNLRKSDLCSSACSSSTSTSMRGKRFSELRLCDVADACQTPDKHKTGRDHWSTQINIENGSNCLMSARPADKRSKLFILSTIYRNTAIITVVRES